MSDLQRLNLCVMLSGICRYSDLWSGTLIAKNPRKYTVCTVLPRVSRHSFFSCTNKDIYLIVARTKCTPVNLTCLSLNGRSLEITLTVPFRNSFFSPISRFRVEGSTRSLLKAYIIICKINLVRINVKYRGINNKYVIMMNFQQSYH